MKLSSALSLLFALAGLACVAAALSLPQGIVGCLLLGAAVAFLLAILADASRWLFRERHPFSLRSPDEPMPRPLHSPLWLESIGAVLRLRRRARERRQRLLTAVLCAALIPVLHRAVAVLFS